MTNETERRFLVTEPSLEFPWHSKRKLIEQAYLEVLGPPDKVVGVRIINRAQGELVLKQGIGVTRAKRALSVPIDVAREIFAMTTLRLKKHRYYPDLEPTLCAKYPKGPDGWIVDGFRDQLEGLIVAERRLSSSEETCTLPGWIGQGIEVTDFFTGRHLAHVARLLGDTGEPASGYIVSRASRKIPKFTIVGGPGSGKSGIIKILAKEFSDRIDFVGEAATAIMEYTRVTPGQSRVSSRRFQLLVRLLTAHFEDFAAEIAVDDGKLALLVERGRPDGAAYLSGLSREYEGFFGVSVNAEVSEYAVVFYVEMPGEEVFEQVRTNNLTRYEPSYGEALRVAESIRTVWSSHPNFVVIPDCETWEEKVDHARRALQSSLAKLKQSR